MSLQNLCLRPVVFSMLIQHSMLPPNPSDNPDSVSHTELHRPAKHRQIIFRSGELRPS